jgi:hypothetical protein
MEDRDFFDQLYQQFTKTTNAETAYWEPVYSDDYADYVISAVEADGTRSHVGLVPNEADADFICGLHGALPELVRRLHDAVDESDRLDVARDEAVADQFVLAEENAKLRAELDAARAERDTARAESASHSLR